MVYMKVPVKQKQGLKNFQNSFLYNVNMSYTNF